MVYIYIYTNATTLHISDATGIIYMYIIDILYPRAVLLQDTNNAGPK